jgi:hypothetical protein
LSFSDPKSINTFYKLVTLEAPQDFITVTDDGYYFHTNKISFHKKYEINRVCYGLDPIIYEYSVPRSRQDLRLQNLWFAMTYCWVQFALTHDAMVKIIHHSNTSWDQHSTTLLELGKNNKGWCDWAHFIHFEINTHIIKHYSNHIPATKSFRLVNEILRVRL